MNIFIAVLIFFIIYGLIGEYNDSKNSAYSHRNEASNRAVHSDSCSDVSSYARSLVDRYNKAYDSHAEGDLKSVAEDLIGYHYSRYYAREYDDCMLLESAAQKRSYIYQGDRSDCRGLSLIEIFRKQNGYINSLPNR